MNQAMILAAGFGTRLLPLTRELPKPVVPIGDAPLLAHLTGALRTAGIERLYANVHHGAGEIQRTIHELELGVEVVYERDIRGTAGGVWGARHLMRNDALLVYNADIMTVVPAAPLEEARRRDIPILAVAPRPRGSGTVGIGSDGSVVRLRGELFGEEASGGDYVGVMALPARSLASLPSSGCLVADFLMPELRRGGGIGTAQHSHAFRDIGDLAAYARANFDWLAARGGRSFVAGGAQVDDHVELHGTIVGAGARITGEGRVDRCVIWPGASVVAPLANAIVTRRTVVQLPD